MSPATCMSTDYSWCALRWRSSTRSSAAACSAHLIGVPGFSLMLSVDPHRVTLISTRDAHLDIVKVPASALPYKFNIQQICVLGDVRAPYPNLSMPPSPLQKKATQTRDNIALSRRVSPTGSAHMFSESRFCAWLSTVLANRRRHFLPSHSNPPVELRSTCEEVLTGEGKGASAASDLVQDDNWDETRADSHLGREHRKEFSYTWLSEEQKSVFRTQHVPRMTRSS